LLDGKAVHKQDRIGPRLHRDRQFQQRRCENSASAIPWLLGKEDRAANENFSQSLAGRAAAIASAGWEASAICCRNRRAFLAAQAQA